MQHLAAKSQIPFSVFSGDRNRAKRSGNIGKTQLQKHANVSLWMLGEEIGNFCEHVNLLTINAALRVKWHYKNVEGDALKGQFTHLLKKLAGL